jgi:hypothetical protein
VSAAFRFASPVGRRGLHRDLRGRHGGPEVQIRNNEGNVEDDTPLGVTNIEAFLEKYASILESSLKS